MTRPHHGWLHIYIEIKPRELDARLFLACCAAERGFEVLIGRQNELRRRANRLPRGIVFEKCISPVKGRKLDRLHRLGHRLVVSDEESQAIYGRTDRYLATRLNDETLAITDAVYCWGTRQAEILAGAYPHKAETFRVTGTPRTDLWRAPLHAMHAAEAEALRARHGRFLLLPSNFGLAIPAKGRDFLMRQSEENGTIRSAADRAWFEGLIAHVGNALAAYKGAIGALRARFPDHKVIVRPHPADDQSHWHREMAGIDGVEVIYEGAVGPWLLAAEAIFHHGCTTAIESFFMGKPTICYLPKSAPAYDDPLLTSTGPVTSDIPGLLDRVGAALGGELVRDPAQEAALRAYFDWDETRSAADRICDDLVRVADEHGLGAVPLGAARPDHPVIGPIRRALGYDRLREDDPKWPGGLTDAEIEDRIAFYRAQLGRFETVTARRLTRDGVFQLSGRPKAAG